MVKSFRARADPETPMTAITLELADRLIDAILERGAELDCRPLSVIVVEPGCKVKVRAEEKPAFMRYLIGVSGGQMFPEGGGLQIRDTDGEVIGAVGVTGDTEDRDEELAAYGIRAVGLKTDEDCAAIGRRGGIRLTDT